MHALPGSTCLCCIVALSQGRGLRHWPWTTTASMQPEVVSARLLLEAPLDGARLCFCPNKHCLEAFRACGRVITAHHPAFLHLGGGQCPGMKRSPLTEITHQQGVGCSSKQAGQHQERWHLSVAVMGVQGMLQLHSHRPVMLHRDLKSSNLVIDRHWHTKVISMTPCFLPHASLAPSTSLFHFHTVPQTAPPFIRHAGLMVHAQTQHGTA